MISSGLKTNTVGNIFVAKPEEKFQMFLLLIDIGLYLYNLFYWQYKSVPDFMSCHATDFFACR